MKKLVQTLPEARDVWKKKVALVRYGQKSVGQTRMTKKESGLDPERAHSILRH